MPALDTAKYLPTPEEIEAETARIRKGWPDGIESIKGRQKGKKTSRKPKVYTAPLYKVSRDRFGFIAIDHVGEA